MKHQTGFAPIILIVGILLISAGIVGGAYYIKNSNPQLIDKVSNPNNQSFPSPAQHPINTNSEPSTSTPSNPTSSVQIPTDWKTLEVKSCAISLKHPQDWEPSIFEEDQSCEVRIDRPKTEDDVYFITDARPPSPSLESLKVNSSDDINVDGVPGLINQTVGFEKNRVTEHFYFKKDAVLFLGTWRYSTSDKEVSMAMRNILASIKFTGDENQYRSNPNDEFSKHLTQNAIYRNVATSLKTVIEIYKIDKGKLPNDLGQLNDGNYLDTWEKDEYHDLSKYTYKKDGDKFSISVKLSNGSDYVVSSD